MTAELTVEAAAPLLRIVPAPLSVPPFDDEPGQRPALRLVTTPEPEPELDEDVTAWLAPQRTPAAELPPAVSVARPLVQAVLEALTGVRAVTQLRRDTTPELYQQLSRQVSRGRRSSGSRPGADAIRSLHVQARPEGVAEVCATVLRQGRPSALALRLEGFEGRWRCTDLVGV